MLQALYSRSPNSVTEQLEKVLDKGASNFMGKFYVGYGHKSIGDCGYVTIFVERVSMLAAKAIQDNPLYSGQEASTRYLDFAEQPIINPTDTRAGQEIIDRWMKFYNHSSTPLREHLKTIYPIKEGENPKVYERAIKARSFDILRAFLPCGTTTYLAWSTNLRQAADHINQLLAHPLQEVREVATQIRKELEKRYASSFSHESKEEQRLFREECYKSYFYAPMECPSFETSNLLDSAAIEQFRNLLSSRPKYAELPKWMQELGRVQFKFLLDFGSYRDLQRHRSGVVRMPLVETRWGFQEWYLDQLPPSTRKEAQDLLQHQETAIQQLHCENTRRQYYIPMGYKVPVKMDFGLPAILYLIELRSGKTVHPTLRSKIHLMHDALRNLVPYAAVHADMAPDDWDIRRGKQTIINTETGESIS